jgi:hypothetical protein
MKANEADLEALAARLRARVGEGRYREAQSALADYCRALRKMVASLPPGDPGLRGLENDWQRLQDETRRRVLVGRAHAAARLARLPKIRLLYREPSLPRHTWECSG